MASHNPDANSLFYLLHPMGWTNHSALPNAKKKKKNNPLIESVCLFQRTLQILPFVSNGFININGIIFFFFSQHICKYLLNVCGDFMDSLLLTRCLIFKPTSLNWITGNATSGLFHSCSATNPSISKWVLLKSRCSFLTEGSSDKLCKMRGSIPKSEAKRS